MTEIELTMVLPAGDLVGTVGDWSLPIKDDQTFDFNGKFLGVSISFREQHFGHHGSAFADQGDRCNACRWFEIRLFRVTGTKRYVIHYAGVSIVPGETLRAWHQTAHGAHETVEAVTTRRENQDTGEPVVFLTRPAARVLAQAAGEDDDLLDAYVNRAVT